MATGGIPQHGLFECAVCFNDMLDRTPRGLACLHSFCETCLKQLIKNSQITCPTCRKSTEVKGNDVTELPIDFKLKQMSELTSELTKKKQPVQVHDQILCQICKVNTSEFKCKECPRLMCLSCKNGHDDIEEYKHHSVFNLCIKHVDSITHLCRKCVTPLCMICMLVNHTHHKGHFEEFSKGMATIKKDLGSLKDQIKSEMSKVNDYAQQVHHKSQINTDTEKDLLDRRKYHENKIKEIDDLLKTTNKNKKTFDKIKETCVETIKECNEVTASPGELSIENHVGLCTKYEQLQEKAENSINAVTKLLSVKYDVTMFVLSEHVPSDLVKSSESGHIMPIKDMKLSKTVLDIPKSDEINCIRQIDFIGSDVVMPSGNKLYHVTRVSHLGQVVDRYYPSNTGQEVNGVTVYEDNIYIVQDKAITVISAENKSKIAEYKPTIGKGLGKVLVKDRSTLYITPWYCDPGDIYRYSTVNDKTQVVVRGLNGPSYLTMMKNKEGTRFIVSELYAHCIRVYDENWDLLCRFGNKGSGEGQFNYPRATAVTPLGTLLIADDYNHRISHYSLDGKLLSHVINQQDGLKQPLGIAFRYPYLWVCSRGDYVKCYLMK